jgi:hypothetical protein
VVLTGLIVIMIVYVVGFWTICQAAKDRQGNGKRCTNRMISYRQIPPHETHQAFIFHNIWGGIGGVFYGSMTFQGIIPYYYDLLHPGQAVELSRWVYNQMADNPKDKRTVDDIPQGRC